MSNELIVIGGGYSLKEGVSKGLWKNIKDKWVINLNYAYKYNPSATFLSYVDEVFYNEQREELSKLPLIIGQKHRGIKPLANTIMLPSTQYYNRTLDGGVFKASLSGIWCLSLAIYLLDVGNLFLLGYDFGEARCTDYEKNNVPKIFLDKIALKDKNGKYLTHWYQDEFTHRGIAKTSYYDADKRVEQDFGVFRNEKQIKIYNVSMISKIPNDIFEKISYDEFFGKLSKETVNQDELRTQIKEKLIKWTK